MKSSTLPLVALLLTPCCVVYRAPPSGDTAIPVLPATEPCRSPCGLVIGNLPIGECGALAVREAEIVDAFTPAAPHQDVCSALRGWHLVLVDSDSGLWRVGRTWVHAATACDGSLTFLGDDPSHRHSSLAHEVGHILDCRDGKPAPTSIHQHDGWQARGFCDAIRESSDLDVPCEHDAVPHPVSARAAH